MGKYICVDRNYFVRSKNMFKVLSGPIRVGAGDRGLGLAWLGKPIITVQWPEWPGARVGVI